MEIVFVTTEVAPYSRASEPSELADVSASLPKALRGLGHKVTVVSPLYRDIDPTARSLARRLSTLNVELRGKTYPCTLYDGRTTGGVDLLFLGNAELFGARTAAESTEELAARAAIVLGSATAQLLVKREPAVDVLHAHGPGGALALAYAKAAPAAPSCVLSLYEGQDPLPLDHEQAGAQAAQLESVGLAPSALALGLLAADGVMVDSESKLRGLLDSSPLSAALSAKGQMLGGVVNGVDASHWNPLIDSHLSARFDATYPSGKGRCKASLQYMFGLGIQPELPVFACIGELSEARGGDLLARAAEAALRNEIQLLVLGTQGAAAEALTELSAHYPERLAVRTSHDDKERHLALGGSDFLVLPARKTLGLDIALAAMRYGALPIVRPIGALADVVVDCDAQLETGNGFVIPEATGSELASTLQRATAAFARRSAFEKLRKRVMQLDLSWERSARRYEHMYKRLRQAQQPAA